MNQKTLLVAIVAVVAVVIVLGIWLSGAGQSGPLAGLIGQTSTAVTLSATATEECVERYGRLIQFSGTLKDASNNPVPNRDVTIYNAAGPIYVTTLKTDANGAFSAQVDIPECCPMYFYAAFAGDSQYSRSQSTTASVAGSNFCDKGLA
jgi:hypothetical protein